MHSSTSEASILAVDLALASGYLEYPLAPLGDLLGPAYPATPVRLVRLASQPAILWRSAVGTMHAQPTTGWETLFSSTSGGSLYAIETSNGFVRWRATIGAHATAPVLFEDIVFASGGDNLYALDVMDGSEVWTATTGAGRRFSPGTVHGGVLYVGNQDGHVYAVHPADGEPFWYTRIGGQVEAAPAVTNDLVFARSSDGNLYALDTITGEIRWRQTIGWTFEAIAPVATNGIVVAGGPSGTVTGLEADTGRIIWQTRTAGVIASTPLAHNGKIYLPTAGTSRRRGTITSLCANTGSVHWRRELTSYLAGALSLNATGLIAGDVDGVVRGIDPQTGTETWSYTRPDGFAASSPIVVDGTLYAGGLSAKMSAATRASSHHPHLDHR